MPKITELAKEILVAVSDAVLVLDKDQTIIIANPAAEQLFHCDEQQLVRQPITTFILQEEGAISNTFECQGIQADGSKIPLEVAVSEMHLGDGDFLIYIVRNIFVRKESEKRNKIRHEITRVWAECRLVNTAVLRVIKIICEAMRLQTGMFWEVDKQDHVLRCMNIWGVNNPKIQDFVKISQTFTFEKGKGLPGRVWEHKKPDWIIDVVEDPNFPRAPWAKKSNLHSAFALPVLFEGEAVGVMEFFMDAYYPFDDHMMNMLEDITTQTGIFVSRAQAEKRVEKSRQAGQADVSISILHIVGNILNSIKVSLHLLEESTALKDLKNLSALSQLIHQKSDQLADFLTNNPKGKLIPDFLEEVVGALQAEVDKSRLNIHSIAGNIQQLEDFIATQKETSKNVNIIEKVFLPEIIDTALESCNRAMHSPDLQIVKQYPESPFLITDPTKLIHILVHLFQNAYDAMEDKKPEDRQLTICIQQKTSSTLSITVTDNGEGIPDENLTRIFALGFTTKHDAHGFGLHNSCLAAKSIGGSLTAFNNAEAPGATFELILPSELQGEENGYAN